VIVCKQCGHHNEDSDTFCGSCGKFLEWTGERIVVAQPAPPPPEPEPEPEPVHHTFLERVKQAVGLEEDPSASEQATQASEPAPAPAPAPPPTMTTRPAVASVPSPATATATPPAPVAEPPPPPYRPVPVSSAAPRVAPPSAVPPSFAAPSAVPPSATPSTVAPQGVAPQADEPISRKPVSVMPGPARPRPTPRVQEAPTRRQPGDLICGQCGEGNEPTRHFCRRCGTSLDEAAVVRLPWYRRIWIFRSRTREAGWRPQRVGGVNVFRLFFRLLRIALVILVVGFLILLALVPPFRSAVQQRATQTYTQLRIMIHPNLDPVTLVSATASSSIAGHDGKLAIDGFSNTYWAARPQDLQPVLHIVFAKPVNLADIVLLCGPSGTAPNDQFKVQPRPAQLHLVFSDGSIADVTARDDAGTQHYTLAAKNVSSVDVHVLSTYPALAGSPVISSVAITEIEFQQKD
jgi:hypothetical protein